MGRLLGVEEFVASDGARGACVGFHPAVQTRRLIHVTPEFMAIHPFMCSDLGDIFAREDNKWEMQSKEGIDAYLTGPADRTKRRQREVLLFLTEEQDGQEEIQFEFK